jgi:hypothetical protein
MFVLIGCILAMAGQSSPVLGVEQDRFAMNGEPTFLLGCSYYGALGVEDDAVIKADLDDLRRLGFNWIRVWATWNAFDHDVSAVSPKGELREPYMKRLKRLCAMAGKRGMIVDVTVSRGKPPFPSDLAAHRAVEETLARELKPFRNVYFDLANERDVRDARYVPSEEIAELTAVVKAVDPERLCTASCNLSPEDMVRFVKETKVDFVAPHRARTPESPAQTAEHTRALLDAMKNADCVVPVHYQEPFRRGYGPWQPKARDFKRDLDEAREGGAAGWCFHNGDERRAEERRPRRSFDMRPSEGRLFEQLDGEEQLFFELVAPEVN